MIYIGSLHYSPTFKSLCCALGKQLEKKDYEITYLFNANYEWMLPNEIKEKTIFIGNSRDIKSLTWDLVKNRNLKKLEKVFSQNKPEYVYLHNIHPFLNIQIAKLTKKHRGKFIQHIHEPYVENKEVYGGIQRYWLYLFENLQEKLLKKTDIAVLSTNEASKLFDNRFPSFKGNKVHIPLIYEDLGYQYNENIENRKDITFIGPPVPAKNPEKFLEIVNYSKNQDLDFLLISRLKIKDKKYYNYKKLKIFHENRISDEKIGNFIENSLMTITPYKTARQSSVAISAYMYGTPVLGTNINGLKEFIKHKKTGYLVDETSEIEEWIKGINYIKKNIIEMSVNCRNYFKENFSEDNWPKYFDEVFN